MFFDSPAAVSNSPPQSPPATGLPLSKAYRSAVASAAAVATVAPSQPTAAIPAAATTPATPATPKTVSSPPSSSPKQSASTNPSSTSDMPDEYDDVPTRSFLTAQALANTAVLHPLSAPTVVTSLDPETEESRTTILSTNPAKVLFQQSGTSTASYEALLAQTERAMHERLVTLNPDVEGLRSAVDTARLQRENSEMLEALERSRGAFQLHLPTRRPQAEVVPEPAPSKSLTPAQLYVQEIKTQQEGLPKSRAQRMKAAVASPPPQESAAAAPATKKTELLLPEPDLSEMVSPRTVIPKEIHPGVVGLKLGGGATSRWGAGDEADDVAAWIREVSEAGAGPAMTPPLTPPIKSTGGLPKSRKFEGR